MVSITFRGANPYDSGVIERAARARRDAKAAITISEVAVRAGVSTATVSRVLAGSDRVAEDTRAKVLAVIESTDYRPSGVARSLRLKSTSVVGLIVTDIQNPFYPEIVRGVEDTAIKSGRSTILCNASNDLDRELAYFNLLLDQRVDGLIIASSELVRRHLDLLRTLNIPVVIANHEYIEPGIPVISTPEETMGYLAAEHLIESGYDPLIYVGGPNEGLTVAPRYEGFKRGAGNREVLLIPGDGTLESGLRVGKQLGASPRGRLGIAAHNDLTAIGILRSLLSERIEVPEDVGLVGCDDIPLASVVTPSLTTIRQDQYEMGCLAMETMHQQLIGNPVKHDQLMTVELIVRESTRVENLGG